MKKKIGILNFVCIFALVVEFSLLFEFVYDQVMKEIPIRDLTVYVFIALFIVSSLCFDFVLRKRKKIGKFLGINLVLWGGLIILIPVFSVDTFLMLSPITKINSHSLNLTYTLAGLGALIGITASGATAALWRLNKYNENNGEINLGMIGVSAFITGAIIYVVTPNFVTYEIVFYAVGILLFVGGTLAEGIDKHDYNIDENSLKSEKMLSGNRVVRGLLTLAITITFVSLKDYLTLNLELTKVSMVVVVIMSGIVVLSVFKNRRIFEQNKLNALIATGFCIVGLVVVTVLGSKVAMIVELFIIAGAFASIIVSMPKSNMNYIYKINLEFMIPILLGYYISNRLSVSYGEFVEFTSKRFYYIPSTAMLFVSVGIGALVSIYLVVNAKKNK